MQHKLPKMEFPFSINLNGKETGVTYVGEFVYKRPSLGMRASIDVMHKKLNGDLTTLDTDTVFFNEAISYLKFTLTTVPDFWKDSGGGMGLYDSNIVIEVYNKCIEFEKEFLGRLHEKKDESMETSQESF